MDSLVKLGQRFVVGFRGPSPSEEFLDIVKKMKIGNIILFKDNIESRGQLKKLTERLDSVIFEATSIHPFIMIDQEGGMVSRLSEDYALIPGAMALAATDDTASIEKCGYITGRELASSGVNFDIAPVLDINTSLEKSILGVRSYGETAQDVIRYSIPMMEGLKKGGVISCAKHFPGHGDVSVDSHMGLPVSYKTEEELIECELKPYVSAIEHNVPCIMTSHILFPAVDDSGYPATMSEKIINGILRTKLSFKGIVITDCLEMGAVKDNYTTEEGARRALLSGVDIACISHTISSAVSSMERIMQDEGWEERQDESFERIMKLKNEYFSKEIATLERDELDSFRSFVDEVGEKTITLYRVKEPLEFSSDTLFIAPHPFVVTAIMNPEDKALSFASTMAAEFGGGSREISIDPDRREIESVLEEALRWKKVVIGTYNGCFKRGQLELVKALGKTCSNLVVVALRNPYDLKYAPENANLVALYEYSASSMRWFIKAVREHLPTTARIPFMRGGV